MDDLRDRLRELPCGRRLLEAAAGMTGVHLVGGAVRDLLLGREPRELDVVVVGDIAPLVDRLGAGDGAIAHERFGTATLRDGACRWDLAQARDETYAWPGALPEVRAAGIEEDLQRRDVTINAIALDLADGERRSVARADEDLRAGRLRVLHDKSFQDDPTRLWRLARYAARLGFAPEEHTAALARQAVADGALETVSVARIGNELRLVLAEPDAVGALRTAAELGLAPWLAPDAELAERALQLLPEGDGRRDLLALAASLRPQAATRSLLTDLQFTAAESAIVRAASHAPALREADAARSRLAREVRSLPLEAVALAGARGDARAARLWLDELRHVRLRIGGDDLIAAGLAESPEVGRRLQAVLDQRLDGELAPGSAAELRAALAWRPDAGTA